MHENEVKDKHVESLWFPCSDEGSTPSRSTISDKMMQHRSQCPRWREDGCGACFVASRPQPPSLAVTIAIADGIRLIALGEAVRHAAVAGVDAHGAQLFELADGIVAPR